jgi:hypothetical protein
MTGLRTLTLLSAAMLLAGSAHAQCPSSGVGTSLKLPFVKIHAPCGYKGREADATTALGPACSTAATGLGACPFSGDRCASNAECAPYGCVYSASPGAPTHQSCDSSMDCLPCLNGACDGAGCSAASSTTCGNVDALQTGYKFSDTGRCTLSAKSKAEKDCSKVKDKAGNPLGLPAGPCHVTYLKAGCKGILRADDTPIGALDDGFALVLTLRFTLDDGSTTLEVPLHLDFDQPEDGQMSLATSTAEALSYLFHNLAQGALPSCTAAEIVGAQITDPFPYPFATVGLATR